MVPRQQILQFRFFNLSKTKLNGYISYQTPKETEWITIYHPCWS